MKSIIQTSPVSGKMASGNMRRFEHQAMATVFGIYLFHTDPVYAAQAAQAAFSELDRLEQELSRFVTNSDIFRLNHLPAGGITRVGWDVYSSVKLCQRFYEQTDGAFDISVGPLVDLWREKKITSKRFTDEVNRARTRIGMNLLRLNDGDYSVQVMTAGLTLDLGGMGKGYALDRMAEILTEWEISVALLHSGYSTVIALAAPDGKTGWPVSIKHPRTERVLKIFSLSGRAISGSGVKRGAHIINPLTAQPVTEKLAAWVMAPTAATADALSTAFMVMPVERIKEFTAIQTDISAIIIFKKNGSVKFFGRK